MTVVKKIAIFNTDHAKPFLEEQWGDFADMAISMFEASRGNNALVEYVTYQIHLDQFPTTDDLKSPDIIGIYITGSQYDSFSTSLKWVVKLRALLAVILQDDSFPPIAGVCFGHQIVAASLGCKVDRNVAGLEGGVVPIQLATEAIESGLFQDDKAPTQTIHLPEVHRDVVYEVPENFINLGSTGKCPVEGLYKKNRVLTLQGHPEFSTEVDLMILSHMQKNGLLSSEEYDELEKRSWQSKNQGLLVANYLWKLFNGEI